ncbi:MAG: NAD(P)-binding protein [Myxococcales bacterium]|nr:NAD(P)-binding protein [Myxococcales bacterium]
MADTKKRKKVAVLGSGCGAMAATWALTSKPGWQDEFDVTVYQMGWRIGGKGAAGRDMENGARIEEHGFHIWLGFYNNAFQMIRDVYGELNRSPNEALATWDQAFARHNYVVLEENVEGEWVNWPLPFPENSQVPGDPGMQNLFELFRRALELTLAGFMQHQIFSQSPQPGALVMPAWLQELLKGFEGVAHILEDIASSAILGLLRLALWLVDIMGTNPRTHENYMYKILEWLLRTIKALAFQIVEPRLSKDTELRRLWILLDISTSALLGMVVDNVFLHGFEVIDDMDFIDWLVKNGLTEYSTDSAPLRAAYDLTFGYPLGDTSNPRFAAGSGLYGLLLLALGYKGSVMWKMLGGMGDTIFTPLYQVLKQRGVKFKFFHKVKEIRAAGALDPYVSEIVIEEQAALKKGVKEYEPFLRVRNLDAWPNQPKWEQLKDGARLKKEGVNFESAWNKTPPVATHTLKKGDDFDLVILGTSVEPLRTIATSLSAKSEPFRRMVDALQTVETIGVQLWLRPTLRNLGWTETSPIVGAYVEPMDTFADMSELLAYEDWSGQEIPQQLTYLCGPLTCPPQPPLDDPDYPAKKKALVKALTRQYLEKDIQHFWPDAVATTGTPHLRWEHLVAPKGEEGEARLDAQFFRANVDPSERYVLTIPGTNKFRLHPGRSGFSNLYLAGDWTWTPFNSGCVECAVISGLLASQSLCGWPEEIIMDEILAK